MRMFSLHLVPFSEITSLRQKSFFLLFFCGMAELTSQSPSFCQDSVVTSDRQTNRDKEFISSYNWISERTQTLFRFDTNEKLLLKCHKTGKYEYSQDSEDVERASGFFFFWSGLIEVWWWCLKKSISGHKSCPLASQFPFYRGMVGVCNCTVYMLEQVSIYYR